MHKAYEHPSSDITTVLVIGPSSAGKTTLCTALAARLQLPPERFVHEVARTVMKATGFSRSTVHKLDMQRAILVAQVHAEERGLKALANAPFLLCDRSAVDPLVYAALGFEDGEQRQTELMQTPEFQAALARYKRSLVILLLPVEEWIVDDGVRSLDRPIECVELFRGTLQKLGIEAKELGPELLDLDKRVDRVVRWCQAARDTTGRANVD